MVVVGRQHDTLALFLAVCALLALLVPTLLLLSSSPDDDTPSPAEVENAQALMASLPCWLAIAAALLVILAVVRLRKHRRGICARCGYDLTGNVSGRCPECGTPLRRVVDQWPR
ncbi:MAG TPA: hypothetical protein PLP66_10530 [Phycisphaerae bacterium]|nr:hypothetical protein [Phycisphaerae bacterium]HPM24330.1 hypothetical protein [Phycisphaerae bacterium]HQL55690.1 hypothetical protein [Phycisphaerae bacterium]